MNVPYLSSATPETVDPIALPKNKNAANNEIALDLTGDFMDVIQA